MRAALSTHRRDVRARARASSSISGLLKIRKPETKPFENGVLEGPNLGGIAQYSGNFRPRRQQFQGAYGASRHKRCAGVCGGSNGSADEWRAPPGTESRSAPSEAGAAARTTKPPRSLSHRSMACRGLAARNNIGPGNALRRLEPGARFDRAESAESVHIKTRGKSIF